MGKACGEEVPQRRVYKHAPERNGVRVALCAVKRVIYPLGPVWHRKVLGWHG
jgi:hypothetical protein